MDDQASILTQVADGKRNRLHRGFLIIEKLFLFHIDTESFRVKLVQVHVFLGVGHADCIKEGHSIILHEFLLELLYILLSTVKVGAMLLKAADVVLSFRLVKKLHIYFQTAIVTIALFVLYCYVTYS